MLGAIIGDIVGSRFEWNNIKTKKFQFLHPYCGPTDDSYMTLAVAKALTNCKEDYSDLREQTIRCMQEIGRAYPNGCYGGRFDKWLDEEDPQPYNSWGNGAAMRVSPCAYAAKTLEEAKELAKKVTEVTHNHPEGLKGAEAVTVAIFLARQGASMEEIKKELDKYYPVKFKLDDIREIFAFDESCQGTVPYSLAAFYESTSFEDAVRNAISIGGDSDTLAAITGSIAEAFYGIPPRLQMRVYDYLDENLLNIYEEFEDKVFDDDEE